MQSQKQFYKCVLAIDPDSKDFTAQATVLDHLVALFSHVDLTVDPVFVVPLELSSIASGLEVEEFEDQVESARRKFAAVVNRMLGAQFSKPMVLRAETTSGQEWVRMLCEESIKKGSDFFAVRTHAWGGVWRFLHGSFTESLLGQSLIPILVFGPKNRSNPGSGPILILSDVIGEPGEVIRGARDWVVKLGHPCRTLPLLKLDQESLEEARLLVLSRSLIEPSRLRALFENSSCPILVFP
jgi:hypothetical protein